MDPFGIKRLDAEPWVHLADGKELASWSHDDEVKNNQACRQAEKYLFYMRAFDFVADNRIGGDYHEFGCHRVRTFRMALTEARKHNFDRMNFFAFDSFAGLPELENETSVPLWKKGALVTTEDDFLAIVKKHGLYVDRVKTFRGFYDKLLTPELQRTFLQKEQKIAVCCIDCDLYESAVPVFKFIEPLLQDGAVIYLDDYYVGHSGSMRRGVALAFREYAEKSAFTFEPHLSIGWWGRSFIAYR